MPKTVGVAVSNATFHFDKLYTYAVMPDQQEAVRLVGGGVGCGPLVCGRGGLSLRAAVPGAAPRIPLGEKGEQGDRRKGRAQE